MARLIKPDGSEELVQPRKGKKWKLEELQAHVEGPIELVPGVRPYRIIVNEEGKLRDLPFNPKATEFIRSILFGQTLRYEMRLHGNVLILQQGEGM